MSKANILKDAEKLTSSTRQQVYGHPSENFANIAEAWTAYFHARGLLERDVALEPRDVSQLNILQKSMRQGHLPTRDNLLDQAGYARTEEMLEG